MVFPSRIIAVCANPLPFNDAPVLKVIPVLESITPSICEVVPAVTVPATCQKIFLANAQPFNVTLTPEAKERSPDI